VRVAAAVPGLQSASRLCDDDRGWLAEVEFTVDHKCGRGKHLAWARGPGAARQRPLGRV